MNIKKGDVCLITDERSNGLDFCVTIIDEPAPDIEIEPTYLCEWYVFDLNKKTRLRRKVKASQITKKIETKS